MYSTYYASPIGQLLLTSNGDALTGLWIEKQKYYADTAPADLCEKADLPIFKAAGSWLDAYFNKEQPEPFQYPLAPQGGPFRQAVWEILYAIPYGQVMTYGQIARQIAARTEKNMSAQAVGGAVGRNPISIIIPCYRVVGKNGSLTGYAGGIDTKIKLLELEGVDMSSLFRPTKGTAL